MEHKPCIEGRDVTSFSKRVVKQCIQTVSSKAFEQMESVRQEQAPVVKHIEVEKQPLKMSETFSSNVSGFIS